jgi:6-phosphogluconolactonase (cycloisomerase 2 family)
MKQVYLCTSLGLAFIAMLIGVQPALEEFLTFGGIQKDDMNDPERHDWIAAVALSPDNRHVYAAGYGRSGVIVFKRDPQSGKLTFIESQKNGVNQVDGLAGALRITVSPDGKHVYAAGYWDYALAVFRRDMVTGKLSFVESKKIEVSGPNDLGRVRCLALSPDGKHVYTANNNDSVVVLKRDALTGKLNFVESHKKGAGGLEGLSDAYSLILSPDGNQVYVTGAGDNTLTVFKRDADTGKLILVETVKNKSNSVEGLEGSTYITMSADGNYLYATGFRANAVVVFKRDTATGKLTWVEAQKNGIGAVTKLCGATALSVSPNGKRLYVASEIDNALAVFSRDGRTGKLVFKKAYRNGQDNVQGLFSPRFLTTSADSRHIYVSGKSNNLILFSTP